jgi:hypothetical protein
MSNENLIVRDKLPDACSYMDSRGGSRIYFRGVYKEIGHVPKKLGHHQV